MSIGTAIRTEGSEDAEKVRVWQALLQKASEERRAVPVMIMARPRWTREALETGVKLG